MKRIYTTILFLIFATLLFSQKETNNWVFGLNNWLDFNTDPVTVHDNFDVNINATRGTVSVSDKEGNLLFYSNARKVFDRNHQIMPNGEFNTLVTNTHPVAVLLKPNSEHSYYLIYKKFTNIPGEPNTLKWLEVDMSLNNGLGDVKVNPNNEIIGGELLDNPTGKITVASHDNLIDFWIISHQEDSDAYYAWLVTASGINSTPVISNIGIPIITLVIPDSANGQIKVSPDGKKIAVVNRGDNNAEIFDFDQMTGILSNTITLNQFISPRGLEFSPSGQYLYISHEGFQTDSRILQFDLWAGNQTAINNSKLSIGNPTFNGSAGALQLASNGKIYSINISDTSLGIIHQPDNNGFTCDFEQQGQSGISGNPFLGFPSFLHKYFDTPYFSTDGICLGNTTTFLIDGFDATVNSVIWDFGDPASGANNTSTIINPSHSYSSSGNYYVTLTITSNNQTFTKKQLIHIAPTSIDIGNDSTLCSNLVLTTDAYTPNATYEWSNGFTTSSIGITTPGTYSVTVSVGNCPTLIDEITVNHISAPNADLGGNGAICDDTPVNLDATNLGASYLWSTGSTTASITAFFGDTYAVTVTNPNGCSDVDEVVYIEGTVLLNPSQANLKCFNDSSGVALVFLGGGQPPFSYLWNDGDTLYTNNHLTAGNYSITVTDDFGCTAIEDFTLSEPDELVVNIVTNADNPNTGTLEGSVLLQPSGGNSPYTFDWETFGIVTNPLVEGLENGIYNITITDNNGCEEIVQANVGDVTSIEEISVLEKIKLFPNPTNDFLFVKIPDWQNEYLEILVLNILGQPMSEISFLKNGKTEFSIDVNDWSSGIYFLKIKMEEEERVWKFNVVK